MAAGRDADVVFGAEPENESRQAHGQAGHAEGPTVSVLIFDPGDDQKGKEGTKIDRPIKSAIGLLQQM